VHGLKLWGGLLYTVRNPPQAIARNDVQKPDTVIDLHR
jgi:hypothetical protein